MVNFSKNGTNGGGEPVRLDAWVASKHPRLHPTRRMVLKVVASLCRDGEWATSSEVRESTDLSQQLLNRHLRGLESDGMLRIVKPGSGLPLNVRPTSMGLRLLGQAESRQVSEEPSWEEPQDQYQPQDEPEAQTPAASDGVSALARRLYQQLEKHLLDLDRRQTEELLARTLRDLGVTPEAPEPAAETLTEEEFEAELEPEPEIPAQPQPPRLNPVEATLEEKLLLTARAEYRNIIWWQRTRDLSDIWERARRRHQGLLTTYFTSFRPRWEYPEWEDFNLARRQADARGADYGDWVQAQYERVQSQGDQDLAPRQLHGEKAIRAYQESRPAHQQASPALGAPPFSLDSFDLDDPSHVAYAEALLDQLDHLAQRVYGDDPVGPVNLLVEAVWRGNLPLSALRLRPEYRTAVMAVLQREHPEFLPSPQSQAAQEQCKKQNAKDVRDSNTPVQTSLRTPLII
ncbi:MAG: helix-turn-helix domain-containing protein [Proteobacteria bacterium]|nr:helix-turn-helix domain-containing protein [Pseudomonadota bacterium]MBU4382434.1 helix-turn-helix domain-containing protein [Pseudomonadota bacterium]MCG2764003.1 helix-turn-helix domain-containing protein [Desulfarculaceae bacterium]